MAWRPATGAHSPTPIIEQAMVGTPGLVVVKVEQNRDSTSSERGNKGHAELMEGTSDVSYVNPLSVQQFSHSLSSLQSEHGAARTPDTMAQSTFPKAHGSYRLFGRKDGVVSVVGHPKPHDLMPVLSQEIHNLSAVLLNAAHRIPELVDQEHAHWPSHFGGYLG